MLLCSWGTDNWIPHSTYDPPANFRMHYRLRRLVFFLQFCSVTFIRASTFLFALWPHCWMLDAWRWQYHNRQLKFVHAKIWVKTIVCECFSQNYLSPKSCICYQYKFVSCVFLCTFSTYNYFWNCVLHWIFKEQSDEIEICLYKYFEISSLLLIF